MSRWRGERFLLLIALERFVRGLILMGAGIYLLTHTGAELGSLLNRLARGIELDPRRPFIKHAIDRVGRLRSHDVDLFGAGALGYGVLEVVEGVGLFLRKRWAEWLTVVATSLLIPFEIYELVKKPGALKAAGLLVNVVIVVYLYRLVERKGRARRTSAT